MNAVDQTTRTPVSKCLDCGRKVDAATFAQAGPIAAPEPNDITLCLHCGHLMAFADDLTLRELTDAEIHEVAGDKRIIAVQKARGMVMKPKPKPISKRKGKR